MKKLMFLLTATIIMVTANGSNPDTIANPYHNMEDNTMEFSIENVIDVVSIDGKYFAEVDTYNDDYISVEIPKEFVDIFFSYYNLYWSSSIARNEWADTYGEGDYFYAINIHQDSIYHATLYIPEYRRELAERLDGWIED